MGEPLGEVFTALRTELLWMFTRWLQFRKLYVDKESRLELLNRSAAFFFWMIQRVLWDDTILGIARIGGPPASAGKRNLAIAQLVPLLPAGVKEEVEQRLAAADTRVKLAIDLRNRHIAHRDWELALGKSAKPLSELDVADIDAALDAMASVLNAVEYYYMNSTTAYRFSSPVQDAEALLFIIRDGLRREDLRRERLERGEYRPEDWDDDAPAV